MLQAPAIHQSGAPSPAFRPSLDRPGAIFESAGAGRVVQPSSHSINPNPPIRLPHHTFYLHPPLAAGHLRASFSRPPWSSSPDAGAKPSENPNPVSRRESRRSSLSPASDALSANPSSPLPIIRPQQQPRLPLCEYLPLVQMYDADICGSPAVTSTMNNQPLRGPASFDRERELLDQRQRAADDMAHREREQGERAHRESYHSNVPHQSSAGSIPIHQPVASRMPGIHSPSGLLANHGSAQAIPLGTPSGPVPGFGGPLHEQQNNRPPVQHGPPPGTTGPQHQLFGAIAHASAPHGAANATQALFGGPLPPQDGHAPMQPGQAPGGAQGPNPQQGGPGSAAQGQQPILNVSDHAILFRADEAFGRSRPDSLAPYTITARHYNPPIPEQHMLFKSFCPADTDGSPAIGRSYVSRPSQGPVPRSTRSLQQVPGHYEGLQEPVVCITSS